MEQLQNLLLEKEKALGPSSRCVCVCVRERAGGELRKRRNGCFMLRTACVAATDLKIYTHIKFSIGIVISYVIHMYIPNLDAILRLYMCALP